MTARSSGDLPALDADPAGGPDVPWEPPLLETAGLDILRDPVWVMDPETMENLYANRAALAMWNARSLDELRRRNFSTTSAVSRARIDEIVRQTATGGAVPDTWTFYPAGAAPVTVECLSSRVRLPDGRIALLKEGVRSRSTTSGKRLAAAFHYTSEAITLYDAQSRAILFRNAAAMLFAPAGGPLVDRFLDPAEGQALWSTVLTGEQGEGVFEVHSGSATAWHHVSARLILDPVTGERTVIVNERDVSALKRVEQDLREREAQLRDSQKIARLGDWRYDVVTGIFHASPMLQDVVGLGGPEISATDFFNRMHPDDTDSVWQYFRDSIERNEESEIFFRLGDGKGEMLQCWARWRPQLDAEGRAIAVYGVTRDVTEEYIARQRIHFLALHDAVTGLANRIHFTERLIGAVEGRSASPKGGLIVLDIVHFKDINDSFGHGTGDQVLREIARRMHGWSPAGALVARIGGDEFGVLLPGTGTAAELNERARELTTRLQEPMEVDGRRIRLTLRAGLSIWPDAGTTADAIQRNADLALYSTKSSSTASIALFTPALRTEADASRALLADLREALAGRQLRPFFQPIVHLATGRVAGFEVLARWTHPVRGTVSPVRFIPVAESGGLIWELGDQMLTAALAQMKSWLDAGLEPGRVAVNMGSGQVNGPEIVSHVVRRLNEADLPAERLELEVTETVTLGHHAEAVMAALQDLSAQGISIVLDDFGTGHASLTHLHGLPVDRIKIDRSFVMGIGKAQSSEVIIRAVTGLAHNLSLAVVAEGVETPEQATFLSACGCDCVQGYLYGYPMPADEATRWLTRHVPLTLPDAP